MPSDRANDYGCSLSTTTRHLRFSTPVRSHDCTVSQGAPRSSPGAVRGETFDSSSRHHDAGLSGLDMLRAVSAVSRHSGGTDHGRAEREFRRVGLRHGAYDYLRNLSRSRRSRICWSACGAIAGTHDRDDAAGWRRLERRQSASSAVPHRRARARGIDPERSRDRARLLMQSLHASAAVRSSVRKTARSGTDTGDAAITAVRAVLDTSFERWPRGYARSVELSQRSLGIIAAAVPGLGNAMAALRRAGSGNGAFSRREGAAARLRADHRGGDAEDPAAREPRKTWSTRSRRSSTRSIEGPLLKGHSGAVTVYGEIAGPEHEREDVLILSPPVCSTTRQARDARLELRSRKLRPRNTL